MFILNVSGVLRQRTPQTYRAVATHVRRLPWYQGDVGTSPPSSTEPQRIHIGRSLSSYDAYSDVIVMPSDDLFQFCRLCVKYDSCFCRNVTSLFANWMIPFRLISKLSPCWLWWSWHYSQIQLTTFDWCFSDYLYFQECLVPNTIMTPTENCDKVIDKVVAQVDGDWPQFWIARYYDNRNRNFVAFCCYHIILFRWMFCKMFTWLKLSSSQDLPSSRCMDSITCLDKVWPQPL